MTKWDRLLVQLDKVFGFEDRKRSTVKKRRQAFDEKTGEHVFIREYRVVKGEHSDPKLRKEKGIERRNNKYKVSPVFSSNAWRLFFTVERFLTSNPNTLSS